jgi:CubicO group peptidase (beta-lactamase class C family)
MSGFVQLTPTTLGIPGVAVAVWAGDREISACHGVTSIDNSIPVDKTTLYVLGSVTKTHTATALMRVVAEGKVDLGAPVRRYVPELRLADERVRDDHGAKSAQSHGGLGLGNDTGRRNPRGTWTLATINDQFGEFLMTKLGNFVDQTVHFYLTKYSWNFANHVTRRREPICQPF